MEWERNDRYERSRKGQVEGQAQWLRLVVVRSTIGVEGVSLGGIVYFERLDPPGSAWTRNTTTVPKVAA
jgi:hypothetical protein